MIYEIKTTMDQLSTQRGTLSADCEIMENSGESKSYSSLTLCLLAKIDLVIFTYKY